MVRREVPDSERFRSLHEEDTNEDAAKPIKTWKVVEILLNVLSILQLVVYFVGGTLALAFPEVNKSGELRAMVVGCLMVQAGEMGFKSLCQSQLKVQNENEYDSLKELARHYLEGELVWDLMVLLLLVLDCCGALGSIPWARLLILLKVRFWQEMVNTLEITFISNCYK